MIASRRLGILGGMFDPIHTGHLDTGAAAQHALELTGLLVVPSNIPPHRPQPIASSFHRFAMVSMAVAGRAGWRAVDLELGQAARSYTADTLRHLHGAGFQPNELFFIAGADAFLEIATWKDYPALLDLAHFGVVSRPGVKVGEMAERLPALASRMRTVNSSGSQSQSDTRVEEYRAIASADATNAASEQRTSIFLIDAMTADVSSTAIRRARLEQRTIVGMVPTSVLQHIEQHALYEASPSRADGDRELVRAKAGRLHGQD